MFVHILVNLLNRPAKALVNTHWLLIPGFHFLYPLHIEFISGARSLGGRNDDLLSAGLSVCVYTSPFPDDLRLSLRWDVGVVVRLCLRIHCRAMHCRLLLLLLLAAKTILSGSAVTQTRDGSNAGNKGSSDDSMRSPNTVSRNKKSRSDNSSDLAGNTTANPVVLSSPSTASSGIQQGKRSATRVLTASPWWLYPCNHKILRSKCIVNGVEFSLNE